MKERIDPPFTSYQEFKKRHRENFVGNNEFKFSEITMSVSGNNRCIVSGYIDYQIVENRRPGVILFNLIRLNANRSEYIIKPVKRYFSVDITIIDNGEPTLNSIQIEGMK